MDVCKRIMEIINNAKNHEDLKDDEYEDLEDEYLSDYQSFLRGVCLSELDLNKYPEIKLIEKERHNSDYYWILQIDDKYYKISGSYSSWIGTEIYEDTIHEVKPVMVEVKQWHRV